jgi:hypothetical protein
MKRAKQLTKRERKALRPARPNASQEKHIHCVSCGAHLDPAQFDAPASATMLRCQHGSQFPSCVGCAASSRRLLEEHDRSGQPVRTASAWH